MALFPAQIIKIDGVLLFYNTSINVNWPDNDTDVATIPGGMQGVSPGADVCEITLENAQPVEGADYDFISAKLNRTVVQVECQQIGEVKKIAGEFMVREASRSSGQGQATMYNATLKSIGKCPKPE